MDLGLRGKNVLITGSTAGIGRRVAETFAEEGANVAICSRSPESVSRAIKELKVIADGKIAGAACNIKNKEEYEAWIAAMAAELGGVDIFIPNAPAAGQGEELSAFSGSADARSAACPIWAARCSIIICCIRPITQVQCCQSSRLGIGGLLVSVVMTTPSSAAGPLRRSTIARSLR